MMGIGERTDASNVSAAYEGRQALRERKSAIRRDDDLHVAALRTG
ncbi:hypothetical protein [Burkholderia ubonensis]|nr:hypothetical protein [Burkholderia ubonensis]